MTTQEAHKNFIKKRPAPLLARPDFGWSQVQVGKRWLVIADWDAGVPARDAFCWATMILELARIGVAEIALILWAE